MTSIVARFTSIRSSSNPFYQPTKSRHPPLGEMLLPKKSDALKQLPSLRPLNRIHQQPHQSLDLGLTV